MNYHINRIQLGSNLLHARSGALANILSTGIHILDPEEWVRRNYEVWCHYWHMSQVVKYDPTHGWIIDEATGEGSRQIPLSEVKGRIYLVNWIPRPLTEEECERFVTFYKNCRYDYAAYIWTTANRLSRGFIPRIMDNRQMCWERNADFNGFFGYPWCQPNEMPYMPLFVLRYIQQYNTLPLEINTKDVNFLGGRP